MSLLSKIHNFVYLRRYQERNASPASRWWKHLKRLLLVSVFLILVVIFNSAPVQSVLEILEAPRLPPLQTVNQQGEPLPQVFPAQNWGGDSTQVSQDTQRFHHIPQGTATLSMPYDWFVSLEAPESSIWTTLVNSLLFRENERFADDDYLLRFGFIRGQQDPQYNPDGLPIGFAKTDSINIPGLPVRSSGIGFTCAACHTGHFVAGEGKDTKEFVIEGGPATTDLGLLTAAISASLGQTALSSKIPFFDNRFERFAKRVLGTQYSAETKAALSKELDSLIAIAQKSADIVKVQEGFSRLDALNRIGNQVFSKDLNRRDNYQPIDAPVNYPHIWTASWFKWVQYDASIMQPLIRNAGESMGVSSQVVMNARSNQGKFQSSIPVDNLIWLENFLKGDSFNQGLQAPAWPFDQVSEADSSYQLGESLYHERCIGCHLPPVNDPAINKHLKPIVYKQNGQSKQTPDSTLDVVIVSHKDIGTDRAQGNVLATRKVNTAGNDQGTIAQQTNGVGIDGIICGQDTNQVIQQQWAGSSKKGKVDLIDGITVKDGGDLSFAFALGAVVQQTIDAWFNENLITDKKIQDKLSGNRPNCLQAGQGYKARPLNGVWATAPFLHNGSVPTIRDLICKPAKQRPKYVLLGDIRFDQNNLGLAQPANIEQLAKQTRESGELYTEDGYFILDTSIAGNSNSGHEFSDAYDATKHYDQKSGVIGKPFTPEECDAILDYLKML